MKCALGAIPLLSGQRSVRADRPLWVRASAFPSVTASARIARNHVPWDCGSLGILSFNGEEGYALWCGSRSGVRCRRRWCSRKPPSMD